MGHVNKTPAGNWRANWRDPAGRQRAKTFPTKREASAYLAQMHSDINCGSYIDPHAAKRKFGDYARVWIDSRNHEATTTARDNSIMRTHVMPRWQETPFKNIDHTSIQAWITDLGTQLSPATVAECHRLMNGVLRSAIRDRLLAFNPCEGIRLPRRRRKDSDDQTATRSEITALLAAVPERYRPLVAIAVGTGLRWGECVGLRWDAIDLDTQTVRVIRVAVEVSGYVTAKPYPKSKAGRRDVPLPPAVAAMLVGYAAVYPPGPLGEVFTNTTGGPVRRTLFRARVWRPALVRAGLLGKVTEIAPHGFLASWPDATGLDQTAQFSTERDAVKHVARHAVGGFRFHDLRHTYATWLVSDGVPINDVASVLGHEQTSTTLDRYTHASRDRHTRVRGVLADFSLTSALDQGPSNDEDPSEEGS
jgi:integrase